MARIAFAAAFLTLLSAAQASAQITFDSDYGGYSQQIGGTTYHYRGGTTTTRQRIGSIDFYNSSNGTTGTSLYSSAGRFDSYSNPVEGWTGSGFIPYSGGVSTYRRSYQAPTYTPRVYTAPTYDWGTYRSYVPTYRYRYRSSVLDD